MLIFRTLIGSRLYGLATPESDVDFLEVYDKLKGLRRKAKHSVKRGLDITQMPLSLWLLYCDGGAHQSLEAMFSPQPEFVAPVVAEIRRTYVPDTARVVEKYQRTIKAFKFVGTFKAYRHALRLELNLTDLLEYGRFNPVLNQEQIDYINRRTENEYRDYKP